jgi:hypothetical protein
MKKRSQESCRPEPQPRSCSSKDGERLHIPAPPMFPVQEAPRDRQPRGPFLWGDSGVGLSQTYAQPTSFLF